MTFTPTTTYDDGDTHIVTYDDGQERDGGTMRIVGLFAHAAQTRLLAHIAQYIGAGWEIADSDADDDPDCDVSRYSITVYSRDREELWHVEAASMTFHDAEMLRAERAADRRDGVGLLNIDGQPARKWRNGTPGPKGQCGWCGAITSDVFLYAEAGDGSYNDDPREWRCVPCWDER